VVIPAGTSSRQKISGVRLANPRSPLPPRAASSVKRRIEKEMCGSVKAVERSYEAFSTDAFTGAGRSMATKRSAENK
jgi:hypothetical protein